MTNKNEKIFYSYYKYNYDSEYDSYSVIVFDRDGCSNDNSDVNNDDDCLFFSSFGAKPHFSSVELLLMLLLQ